MGSSICTYAIQIQRFDHASSKYANVLAYAIQLLREDDMTGGTNVKKPT